MIMASMASAATKEAMEAVEAVEVNPRVLPLLDEGYCKNDGCGLRYG